MDEDWQEHVVAEAQRIDAPQARLDLDAILARCTNEASVEVGQEGEYTLVIRNTGTDKASDIKVVATVPPLVRAADAQGPARRRP